MKVSAIIPNYNHARFLEKRLETVFGQLYEDIEVIFLDDASQDTSVEDFRRFIDSHSVNVPVNTILNDENSGSTFRQWQRGVSSSRGEYLWFAESDDWSDPAFLCTLVKILDRSSNVGLAFARSKLVDETGNVFGDSLGFNSDLGEDIWERDFTMNGREFCRRFLLHRNVVLNASSALIRRTEWLNVGGAEQSMTLSGDRLLWAKLLSVSDVAYTARPLNYFRCHQDSVRSQRHSHRERIEEKYRVVSFIAEKCDVPPADLNRALDQLACRWCSKAMNMQGKTLVQRLGHVFRPPPRARDMDPRLYARLARHCTRRLLRGAARRVRPSSQSRAAVLTESQ